MVASSKTCVVVPAYNAQETVGLLVDRVRALGHQALVVDDGSTDETAARANAAGAGVLRLARNRGKGHALVSGFRFALDRGCDHIVTMEERMRRRERWKEACRVTVRAGAPPAEGTTRSSASPSCLADGAQR